MSTHAEQLPIEIWFFIFEYLEGHQIFKGFQNLNNYFKTILASNQLSFYIRLQHSGNKPLEKLNNDSYWSNSVLNRIKCLQSSIASPSSYSIELFRYDSDKLNRLQNLKISTYLHDHFYIAHIYRALKKLPTLEYLSIQCTPNEYLFETILSMPNLRVCQLALREFSTEINHSLNVKSPMKQLFIICLGKINYSIVHFFLNHTTELKRFELSGSSFSFDQISIFSQQLFVLPKLRILKLKLESGHFTSDCFKCLNEIMPWIKSFYFHYTKHILNETFFDYFILNWWAIIETIQYIYIYIKGYINMDLNDNNNIQVNLEKSRKLLMEKANHSNKSFKIEWTQQDFLNLRLIEITIIKS